MDRREGIGYGERGHGVQGVRSPFVCRNTSRDLASLQVLCIVSISYTYANSI